MPKYEVIIPVLTRVEERHVVQADSAEEALDMTQGRQPENTIEDEYFYTQQFDQAEVTLISSDLELLAEVATEDREGEKDD